MYKGCFGVTYSLHTCTPEGLFDLLRFLIVKPEGCRKYPLTIKEKKSDDTCRFASSHLMPLEERSRVSDEERLRMPFLALLFLELLFACLAA